MGTACKKTYECIILLLLLAINASGQPKCKVEFYSTEQGLSHQAITAMVKDSEGFMWFGSWDGINRFDGHTFVSFKSSAGDFSKLGNDRIDQIVEDQCNHLWIEAYDRQIYRFDKKNGEFLPLAPVINKDGNNKIIFKNIVTASNGLVWLLSVDQGIFCVPQTELSSGNFINFRKEGKEGYQLPDNNVNFFHQDHDNQIWIGTPNGLCCLSSTSGKFRNKNSVPNAFTSGVNITAVEEDPINLYFGTADGRLIIYHKKSKGFSFQKIAGEQLNFLLRSKKTEVVYATSSSGDLITFKLDGQKTVKNNYSAAGALQSIYEDNKGKLWLEPEKSGVVLFDPVNRLFTPYSQKAKDPYNSIGNRFRVLEDNNNVIWVNMKGGGFGYYDTASKNFDYLLQTADAVNYSLPNIVYNIYYDKAGVLWLTTVERELIKIVLHAKNFQQQLLVKPPFSKWDNEVRGIFYDNKNRLWLGVKSGKLYIYQNGREVSNLFVNEPPEGLGQVYTMLQDSRGNIWLGTKWNGLYKASPINKEGTKYHLTHFTYKKNDLNGLQCNEIYSLIEDKKGRLWMGSFDHDLTLIVDNNDSTKFIQAGALFTNYPTDTFHKIRKMALDGTSNLWIATTDGLLILNTDSSKSYKPTAYRKIPGDLHSLGNNDIQFIYRDSKDNMWLGTAGGGFCLATGKNPFEWLRFQNYTTKDGMPNDYVLSCTEDLQGNIWVATENGLTKFNPHTRVFRNYDSYDGLPKLAFSEASVCPPLPDGRLVFGTTKGFLSFDPGQINIDRIPANISLTNIQINNQDMRPGANETILKTDINYLSGLTLNYNQNIISVDYSILDHRSGNRQLFAYRLMGFDTIWHDDRQQRRATYTNLPPGHYLFEVKSPSLDLYSNLPYRKLAITILPPPWKTWWAYCLYIIFIGTLLFFVRRYAIAMIRLRNKIALEQKLAVLKLDFFTNVSHELRTPLTLIVNPLEQVARKGNLNPELASYIEVARKNAGRMIHFINQLLDLRKIQSDKTTLVISKVEIVTFVKKISAYFVDAASRKRIKFEFVTDQPELIAWIDAEKLDVVIYNLLGNALKFTPEEKTIRILVKNTGAETFSIAIHDQGPGVPNDKLDKIFELFQEVGLSDKRQLKGTGIGLALSREFINLHQGKIWAINNDDHGLTVTVELQLGFEHYKGEGVSFADMPKTSHLIQLPLDDRLLPHILNATSTQSQQAPLVLLVEDNDELQILITGQLKEFYRVESARNGEEGLEKAITLVPDFIVSDILMPRMNGIEMLDKVKNNINTSHIPVVLLTAKYSIESQIEGLRYGADYYITKPFNNEFLIASIDNLLRQRKKLFESLVEKKKAIALSPSPIVITSKDETFLKEVIKVVELEMGDPDFNVESLAANMLMNQNTFYKKFKSLTSLTIVEFLRDMRLQRAKQLLDAGGNNISEVAYEVGFNNPKYFSTCFKQKYQVSPSDYVKSNVS